MKRTCRFTRMPQHITLIFQCSVKHWILLPTHNLKLTFSFLPHSASVLICMLCIICMYTNALVLHTTAVNVSNYSLCIIHRPKCHSIEWIHPLLIDYWNETRRFAPIERVDPPRKIEIVYVPHSNVTNLTTSYMYVTKFHKILTPKSHTRSDKHLWPLFKA